MQHAKILSHRFTRFILVGCTNTLVSFLVLNFAYYGLHTSKLWAGIVATGCAIVWSFGLNRSFVFNDKTDPLKKAGLFTLIMIVGVLIIQNSVYALVLFLLQDYESKLIHVAHSVIGLRPSANLLEINLSNFIASAFVMLWNYNGYRLFVFNGGRLGHETRGGSSVETP